MIINLDFLSQGGGGGITQQEVETIVDEKITTKVDYSEYENKIQEIDENFYQKQDTLESGINIKTINGEDILGEGDITIESGGDEHFKYNPTEEFTDGIVVYGGETLTYLPTNQSYSFKKRLLKIDFSIVGDNISFGFYYDGATRRVSSIKVQDANTLYCEVGISAILTVYKNNQVLEVFDKNKTKGNITIENFNTSDLRFEYEDTYERPNCRYNYSNGMSLYEVDYNTNAYLANNGDKKEIALKEDIAALEEQIGDMSDYYTKEETDNKFVQKTVPSVSYVLLGVTHIDEYLDGVIPSNQYSGKTSYTDFIINEGIVSIGNNAFGACNGLTSVMIPNSVTSIGNSAFQGCKNLTSVKIPDSVTSFGTNVFQSCSGLTSANIPSTFTTVYEGMFYICTKLSSIEIPKSVTSLGKNAFLGCSGLTSLEIPSSVTSVGQQALASLKSLTSITIPPSVTTFGSWAFDSNPTSGTLYCDEVWFNTYKSKLGNLANWTRKPLPKSLEERVTALEEQIGDINNTLETIIG